MPEISVIIPAYNAESFLSEAIESVLNQSFDDVECIVVDDGSTDGTAEIAQKFAKEIIYLYQENSDRSVARNNGIEHASGKYIIFLDADDSMSTDKLLDQWSFLESNQEYDVVYSKIAYFHEGNDRQYYVVRRPTPQGDIVRRLIWTSFLPIHAPLIRRRALSRAGLFDPTLNRYEDWDLFLRLGLTGARFAYLDKIHAYCRVHLGNTVQDKVRMFAAKNLVAEKIVSRYKEELESRDLDVETIIAFHKADYGRIMILDGQVEDGLTLLNEGCRKDIPHRFEFLLFGIFARCFGHQLLLMITNRVDQIRKYKSTKI